MPRYVSLIDWTLQGVANFKETVDRYEAAAQQFEQLGVRFVVYWTLGEHDIVAVLEAPDDETATAALLATGSQGKHPDEDHAGVLTRRDAGGHRQGFLSSPGLAPSKIRRAAADRRPPPAG
jgi:uncharacterized protein with GYD domain